MTLYHGSKVADIRSLEPRSKLHGSPEEKVVYLSGSIPFLVLNSRNFCFNSSGSDICFLQIRTG